MELPELRDDKPASTVLEPNPGQASTQKRSSSAKKTKNQKSQLPFKFKDVYSDIRRGELNVSLATLATRDIWALANHAVACAHHDFFESCARVLLASSAESTHLVPLLMRNHIIHLRPETALSLFSALPQKQQALQAATLFAHPGIINNPTMLSQLSNYFGGSIVPGERMWPSLDILATLTKYNLHKEAYALLQRLVATGRVPPEALHSAEAAPADFSAIVLCAVARACLYWSLRRQAARYAMWVLMRMKDAPLGPAMGAFAVDMLGAVVAHASPEEAQAAVSLFRTLVMFPSSPRVPENTLQALYDVLCEHGLAEEAAKLYSLTRRAVLVEQHAYPPPSGAALPWLMAYFCRDAKDAFRARILAEHVAETSDTGSTTLAPGIRAAFIALAAENGFAAPTRVLWERYAHGRFGVHVHANARVLVRICRLFASLASKESAYMSRLLKQRPRSPTVAEIGDRVTGTRDVEDTGARLAADVRPDATVHGARSDPYLAQSHADPPNAVGAAEQRPAGEARQLTTPASEAAPRTPSSSRGKFAVREHNFAGALAASQARHDDLVAFARQALAHFRAAKAPLEQAERADLNALARAHFALGDVREGFDALAMVTRRAQTPDRHDTNVALFAVAQDDPNAALDMIRRMAARGQRPDSVALGTVLHHALQQGELDDVAEVLDIAREHAVALDLKTLGSVIRFAIEYAQGDIEATRDTLRRALVVLRANASFPFLMRADMGIMCVRAALEVHDAALAYDLWNTVLRTRAEKADRLQLVLRAQIAKMVWEQRETLGVGMAREVCEVLRVPGRKGGPEDVARALEGYDSAMLGADVAGHAPSAAGLLLAAADAATVTLTSGPKRTKANSAGVQ